MKRDFRQIQMNLCDTDLTNNLSKKVKIFTEMRSDSVPYYAFQAVIVEEKAGLLTYFKHP